jgi:hypothetical protein
VDVCPARVEKEIRGVAPLVEEQKQLQVEFSELKKQQTALQSGL